MNLDFIKIPYTTAPSMNRNTGTIFVSNPSHEIIENKKQQLEKFSQDLWAQMDGMEKIVNEAAKFCRLDADNILDLAIKLEEDVAIMHDGKLVAICFCFPSGFVPRMLLGKTLTEIHMPVPDNTILVNASPGITRVMTEQPSFKRSVWTVTTNPNLNNHPYLKSQNEPKQIDDLYFRFETQTTARVNDKTSLFFVKVNVYPLRDVWDDKILDSINSMSNSILEYKNLVGIKKLLNQHYKN